MDVTDQHIVEEMWVTLRDGVVREWESHMAVTPDVTKSSVTLHSFYGSLDVRFDPARRKVHLALRPCCERADCPTPVSRREIYYEPVIKSGGRRGWRRASFEHGQECMARLVVYHLLKHRGPA